MIERTSKVFSGKLVTMHHEETVLTVLRDVEIAKFVSAYKNRIFFYLDKDMKVVGATILDSNRGLSVDESRDGLRYRKI